MKKPSMPKVPAMPRIDFRALAEDFKSLDPKDIDWKSQIEELDGKRQEEAKLRQEYLDKKKQAVNLEEHRKQLAEVDKSFGTLLKQLPNKAEMEALLIDINQAGLGRGLQFELFKPGRETIRDFYAELPITLKINGSYHDLGAFAADVAKLSRVVSLTNLAIAPDKGGQLKMNATAMTYRYLDEEELAAQRRAKAAQTKAKGAKK